MNCFRQTIALLFVLCSCPDVGHAFANPSLKLSRTLHGTTSTSLSAAQGLFLDSHLTTTLVASVEAMASATTGVPSNDATTLENATKLSDSTIVLVFLAGVFPFAWATVEFWRRIAFGESFGTGSDSVVFTTIGEEDAPQSSRGQRVLGKGALVIAYALFAIAFGVLALVIGSVLTTPDMPIPTEMPMQ